MGHELESRPQIVLKITLPQVAGQLPPGLPRVTRFFKTSETRFKTTFHHLPKQAQKNRGRSLFTPIDIDKGTTSTCLIQS